MHDSVLGLTVLTPCCIFIVSFGMSFDTKHLAESAGYNDVHHLCAIHVVRSSCITGMRYARNIARQNLKSMEAKTWLKQPIRPGR
jgi:hypothetical protein